MNAGGASLPLEERLRRVTRDDLARVTPNDVQRTKARLTQDELHRAMRLLLEENRFGAAIESAPTSSLREAASGHTASQLNCFATITRANLLSLYNALLYFNEARIRDIQALLYGH
ncbi:hypothetical protein ERJ75_001748100 [Trypanosoma vivax]|uniref:Uncharacterized protein n=1 Tax=Trypanosoma vivax (strain Y486) TaxID=1055687 RepID=G0U2M3_TRYVY|nr:hypothetical protein ERJ75_001748100 [Trypanosoma vivax]CCC50526.1 conserved hypothetical protein [Trypanosoma vivax Y486]